MPRPRQNRVNIDQKFLVLSSYEANSVKSFLLLLLLLFLVTLHIVMWRLSRVQNSKLRISYNQN